jgi:hypothetical protein
MRGAKDASAIVRASREYPETVERERQPAPINHFIDASQKMFPARDSVPPMMIVFGFNTLTTSAATSPELRQFPQTV